jgi:hypothetical protein
MSLKMPCAARLYSLPHGQACVSQDINMPIFLQASSRKTAATRDSFWSKMPCDYAGGDEAGPRVAILEASTVQRTYQVLYHVKLAHQRLKTTGPRPTRDQAPAMAGALE